MRSILNFILAIFPLFLLAQQKGVIINKAEKQRDALAKTYAVVVGISDYQDPGIPDLRFADKDAEAFANYLRSDAGGKLDADHLKCLTNQQATMAQFANALDWLWEVCKEGDQAIIYFSGHGDVEKKSLTQPGFLLCWDAPARVYMAGGAFALPMLQEVVSTLSIQNKAKVIVITDACHSGKLAGSSVSGSQATASNLAKQFGNEIKIMSCQPNEYSIEGEQWGGGRGAFSFHLIDALYGLADANNDQWITLQETGRYLEDHVSNEVAPVSQIPMIIGNRNERITSVDEKTIASIKTGKTNQGIMLSSIESRGIEEDVLAGVDTFIRSVYHLFKSALKEKIFLEPKNACADLYYNQLILEPKLIKLHSTMRRNYAAALQDDAQQVLNIMLKTGLTSETVSGKRPQEIYSDYPELLDRAAELLGKEHYMYSSLQARKAFFNGKIQTKKIEARHYYHRALHWQPEMAHAMVEMISTFDETERDSAEYYSNLSMNSLPQWIIPYIKLSNYYSRILKDKINSKSLLDKASDIDPNSELLWYSKARFYESIGELNEAQYWFEKAVATTGVNFCFNCALMGLANVYIETKQYENAEKVLLKAVELDSSFSGTLNRLGKVYWLTEKYEESEKIFLKEIRMVKNEHDKSMAYNELGNLYISMGKNTEAEAYYYKSMEADSLNPNSYVNLGWIYLKKGNLEIPRQYALKLLKIHPDFGFELLIEMRIMENKLEDALNYSKEAVKEKPSNENYYIMVCMLALNGKIEEAYELLEIPLKRGFEYDRLQKDKDLILLRAQEVRWENLMKKYFPDKYKDK